MKGHILDTGPTGKDTLSLWGTWQPPLGPASLLLGKEVNNTSLLLVGYGPVKGNFTKDRACSRQGRAGMS